MSKIHEKEIKNLHFCIRKCIFNSASQTVYKQIIEISSNINGSEFNFGTQVLSGAQDDWYARLLLDFWGQVKKANRRYSGGFGVAEHEFDIGDDLWSMGCPERLASLSSSSRVLC